MSLWILAKDPMALCRGLFYYGGRRAGAAMAQVAAGKRLVMEMGGVCASVVARYLQPEYTPTEALASGIVSAAGQNCVHTQRMECRSGDLR